VHSASYLLECLLRAGMSDVVAVEPAAGGLAALAGVATRRNAPPVFVKAFADPPGEDVFVAEAEGLAALREFGGVATPEVILADRELLVLSVLRPRPRSESFWEQFAYALARLHLGTTHPRFGWHRDNWLGRRRQINTWDDDGFAFFARHRLLRWLGEPRVEAALDAGDRAALERLCHRLPDLLPDRPACLTHGDLWAQNLLATPDGRPALIDPAVSYMWADVDLAHVWSTSPPPEARRFFAVYAELTSLDGDWRARMPIVQLRQHLAVLAQFDDDWGAGDQVRTTLAPFRTRTGRRVPDAIFTHPRLAPLYDAFDGDREDLAAYVGIADELGAERVLDVGCGTGSLAFLLAETGRTVVGVDPAEASLEIARAKDPAARITWIHGDATTVPALDADLAVMTGNVAQVFLTDEDWAGALQDIHAALRPGGQLAFETRRPERRAWEEWAADDAPVILDISGIGRVERTLEVTDVSLPFVSFRSTFRFLADGAVLTSDSTLRFRSREEVEAGLLAHGYRVLDVRDAADRPGREFVFLSERV